MSPSGHDRRSSEIRKGTTNAWIAAVLLLALILYPLSTGPVMWFIAKCGFPGWLLAAWEVVYLPLEFALDILPESQSRLFNAYIDWWLKDYFAAVPPRTP